MGGQTRYDAEVHTTRAASALLLVASAVACGNSGSANPDAALGGSSGVVAETGGSSGASGAAGGVGSGTGGLAAAGGTVPAMGGAAGGLATGGNTPSGGVTGLGGTGASAGGAAGAVSEGGSGGSRDAANNGGAAGADARDAGAAGGRVGNDAASDAAASLSGNSLAVRFANAVMSRWPDPNNISDATGFEYNHGIVLRGIEQVYRRTQDARYLAYIKKYIDEHIDGSGAVDIPSTHSFDTIEPSVLLPFLFQATGTAKYQTAADKVRARYDSIPRNADRGYWHKQQYPNQMWLDSIYMGEPFLARYAAVLGTCGSFCADTVAEQTLLLAEHVQDSTTGLLYHAWDDSPAGQKAAWADATTGRSPVIWGRAMGWYAMALVDTLDDLPESHARRSDMLAVLTSLAAGIKRTQDAKTGLWYQVTDQGSKSDNWLETSASGMFVYALKVAVTRSYLDAGYLTVAQSGWQGLQTKVGSDGSGAPTISGAVQGMGVQTSYAGYISQSTLSNSPHGLCAILLAASEMEAR
jgi:unsaturated rhamnogalacturonyl hydrolase